MSLYYVTRPDSLDTPDPVFTRYGAMTSDLGTALRRSARCSGKVFATDGVGNRLIRCDWVAPAPVSTRVPYRSFQRIQAEAALFGTTVTFT